MSQVKETGSKAMPPDANQRAATIPICDIYGVAVADNSNGITARREAPLKFDWEGGLAEVKSRFSAVELQHHLNELR